MTTIVLPPYGFIADLEGGPLEDGHIYVGTINLNPLIEANRLPVFADTSFTVPLAQPVRTQSGLAVGQNGSPVQIFTQSAGYSIVITDRNGSLVYSNPNTTTLSGSSSTFDNYSVDTGVANAYVVASATPLTSYVAGMRVAVKILNTNTGPSTLDYMGLGPKAIIQQNGAALIGYELFANGIFIFEYDGISFQLISQFYMQGGDVTRYGAVGNGSVAGGTGTNDAGAFAIANALGYPVLVTHGKIYRISVDTTLTQALIINGGQISVDSGVTLTLNGPLEVIDSVTPFVGPGYVVFSTVNSRQGRLINILPDRAAGVPVRGGQQFHSYGDSYTAGNAAGAALCFSAIFASRNNCVENNHGVSGRGVTRATYEAFGTLPFYGSRSMVISWMAGFNDLHYSPNNPKTLVKLTSETMAFLANAFLKDASNAFSGPNVTRVGAWLNAGPLGVWAEKGRYQSAGAAAYTTTNGDKITYAFNGTNVVVFYFQGSNGVYTLAPIEVRIDGVLVETLTPNNTTDGNVGFPEVYENLTHAVAVYHNLGTGAHTIEFRHVGAGGNLMPVDSFGVLAAPGDCPSVLMTEIPHVDAAGYAGPELGRSKTLDDNGSAAIRTGLETFRVLGYPVAWVPINDYYNYQANIAPDHDHPGVAGHAQIAAGLCAYIQPQNFDISPSATFLKAATQAVTTATLTAITYSSALDDRHGFRDATNTSRFLAPFTGTMRLSGVISWAANAAGVRDAGVYVNGAGPVAIIDGKGGVAGLDNITPVCVSFPVVAGDYAEIKVSQNTGGNLNLQTNNRITVEMLR